MRGWLLLLGALAVAGGCKKQPRPAAGEAVDPVVGDWVADGKTARWNADGTFRALVERDQVKRCQAAGSRVDDCEIGRWERLGTGYRFTTRGLDIVEGPGGPKCTCGETLTMDARIEGDTMTVSEDGKTLATARRVR